MAEATLQMRTDFLLTVAEVAVALAGFAGLVVAISGRRDGPADEARLNLQLLKNVLGASFMAAGFALLPVALLSMEVHAGVAWRVSAGLLALALPLYMLRTVPSALAEYRSLSRPVPLSYRLNFAMALAVIGALGLSVVDVIPTTAYLPAVSYLVYAAASSFVRVFLSVARTAVQQAVAADTQQLAPINPCYRSGGGRCALVLAVSAVGRS